MEEALDLVENIWLKDTKYLTGDEISIADIVGISEIEQPSKFQLHFQFFNCKYSLFKNDNNYFIYLLTCCYFVKN